MCYHLITYIEYGCTHQYPTRRHYIDCNGANCRLSRFHKPIPHDCAAECAEIILPDQAIVMEVRQEHCDACLGRRTTSGTNGEHRYNGTNTEAEIRSESDTSTE